MNTPLDFADDNQDGIPHDYPSVDNPDGKDWLDVADENDLRGFDGMVPQDSAWLIGKCSYKVNCWHWEYDDEALDKALFCLGSDINYKGPEKFLRGTAFVKITAFRPALQTDSFSYIWNRDVAGEPYFLVYIDVNGDDYADEGVMAGCRIGKGEEHHLRSGQFQEYGDVSSRAVSLHYYNAKFLNVHIMVFDKDLLTADDFWASFTYTCITQSSDIDLAGGGGEYYARDRRGNEIWFRVCGFTGLAKDGDAVDSDVSIVEFDFYNAFMHTYPDLLPWDKGEMFFKTWVGAPNDHNERPYHFGYYKSHNVIGPVVQGMYEAWSLDFLPDCASSILEYGTAPGSKKVGALLGISSKVIRDVNLYVTLLKAAATPFCIDWGDISLYNDDYDLFRIDRGAYRFRKKHTYSILPVDREAMMMPVLVKNPKKTTDPFIHMKIEMWDCDWSVSWQDSIALSAGTLGVAIVPPFHNSNDKISSLDLSFSQE